MPILYEFALSPFVQKVKIALREKGIDFDRRNGFDPAHGADFARGNPRPWSEKKKTTVSPAKPSFFRSAKMSAWSGSSARL